MAVTTRIARRCAALLAASALATAALATSAPSAAAGAARESAVTSAPLVAGLYQSAYSERNGVLWVASSLGIPPAPIAGSTLVKVDPRTLRPLAGYPAAAADPAVGGVEAVYGLDVDDEHNTVWASATRTNSVAVYDQRTGQRIVSLPNVVHGREVLVDTRRDTAWISSVNAGQIIGFDTATFAEKERVTVAGARPTGLALNERTGAVYAADIGGNRIIEVSADGERTRLIPTGTGPISVALSGDGRTAYTANQTDGTMSVVDLGSGVVTATVATGAGPQSVRVDRRTGKVLVANRVAGTLTVIDPCRAVVLENLTLGALLDHVEIVRGVAFVTDKSKAGPQGQDQLHRIRIAR